MQQVQVVVLVVGLTLGAKVRALQRAAGSRLVIVSLAEVGDYQALAG